MIRLFLFSFFIFNSCNIFSQYVNYTESSDQSTLQERLRFALPLALGANYVGYAEGPEAQYYNPAGLAFTNGITHSSSYFNPIKNYFGMPENFFFTGSYSNKKLGAISFGIFTYPKSNNYSSSYSGNQFSIDYSRKFLKWLAIGASISVVPSEASYYSKIDPNTTWSPVSFGISTLAKWNLNKRCRFGVGFVAKNFSPLPYSSYKGIKWDGTEVIYKNRYNPVVSLGTSYEFSAIDSLAKGLYHIPLKVLFTSDFIDFISDHQDYGAPKPKYDQHDIHIGVGTMLTLFSLVDLITSYNIESSYSNLRLGMGLNCSNLFFNKSVTEKWKIGMHILFDERVLGNRFNYNNSQIHINTVSIRAQYFFKN